MKSFLRVLCLWSAFIAAAFAATTPPAGGMRITLPAGNGIGRTTSVLSLPLYIESTAGGQLVGRIASVTSNTITVTSAGWTAGQLSVAATPHFLRIASGNAKGRSFLISTTSANTSSTLTIDAGENVDLTTLGITTGASGDSFKIFAADTIGNVFPAHPTVLGGTSAAAADNLLLFVQGAWRTYFYSTTLNRWTESTLGSPNATNVAIRPDAAVMFTRLANTALTFSVLGTVPATDRRAVVSASGVTFSASGWPVNLTLGTSGIQSISGWRTSTAAASADTVLMLVGGAWQTFFHDGTNWKKSTLGTPIANSQVISAGTGLIITRAAGAGTGILYQPQPYTF